jgi:hypothetical protein
VEYYACIITSRGGWPGDPYGRLMRRVRGGGDGERRRSGPLAAGSGRGRPPALPGGGTRPSAGAGLAAPEPSPVAGRLAHSAGGIPPPGAAGPGSKPHRAYLPNFDHMSGWVQATGTSHLGIAPQTGAQNATLPILCNPRMLSFIVEPLDDDLRRIHRPMGRTVRRTCIIASPPTPTACR